MELSILNDIMIQRFTWDVIDTNSWLIKENGRGLLIDAIYNDDLFDEVRKLEHLTIVLTHCHFDHICGLNTIRKINPDTRVIATSLCSESVGSEQKNLSSIADAFMAFYLKNDIETMDAGEYRRKIDEVDGFTCEPADETFDDEMTFDWEGHKVELTQYSGHSPDSLIATLDGKYMFSGDTILGIPTATRLPKGSTSKFWNETIPRLKELVSVIEEVFPGHGDSGKLADMIELNESLRKK